MRSARRFLLHALAAVVAVAGVVVAAWAVDMGRSQGKVVRNVTLGGSDVGGLSRTDLVDAVAALAQDYRAATMRVETDGPALTLSAADIALTVDEAATVEATLDAGRDGNPVERVAGWLSSFLNPTEAPVEIRVDEAALHGVVAAADEGRTPPTEPSIRVATGGLEVVAGVPGLGVDPAAVLDALPEATRVGATITVRVKRGPVPPRFSLADARRVADAGEAATATPLAVTVDGHEGAVPGSELRSWLRSEASDAGMRLTVDHAEATRGLRELLDDVGTPPVETSFTVVDGIPQVVPGQPGASCCAPEAGARVEEAVMARLAGGPAVEPVALPATAVPPEFTVEEAEALGIKEVVGTFTTNYAPNQSRVTNIHRIADLVRGQVILPDKTFSINGFVGERTTEKGFVPGGVIEEGRFTESVGGGISQFATTTFNAAFFAGLEFPEYQSHSLYISRYPYGREATLSFPKPDLRIRNPSPYGVLIWPTYTARSITVTLYSTRWVDVAQTNQTREQRGPCTRVRTERTRTFLDGTTKVDSVGALYRPAEGVDCT